MRSTHVVRHVAPTVVTLLSIAAGPALGSGDVDGDGDVDLADFGAFSACVGGPGVAVGRECIKADFDHDRDVDLVDFGALQAAFSAGPVPSPVPDKSIQLDLIGIHDPGSDDYDANCTGCHGDRTNEVALDGVTPASHSRMLETFGGGNEACVACHQRGPNFLNQSAANVRKQVNIEEVGCTVCHGQGAPLTVFYVR